MLNPEVIWKPLVQLEYAEEPGFRLVSYFWLQAGLPKTRKLEHIRVLWGWDDQAPDDLSRVLVGDEGPLLFEA